MKIKSRADEGQLDGKGERYSYTPEMQRRIKRVEAKIRRLKREHAAGKASMVELIRAQKELDFITGREKTKVSYQPGFGPK